MRFSLDCFDQMNQDTNYESVVWYKNYGPHSGGSLIHPHMQIVGFKHEDGYKYIHPNNFEGKTLFDEDGVEVNIAEHPVRGYTELNINLIDRIDVDLWADWLQSGAKYLLNVMYNGRCDSYNLFFYPRNDGGICAKFITRFEAPPYFVGYKLSQVNDEITLDKEAHRFRKFYDEGSKVELKKAFSIENAFSLEFSMDNVVFRTVSLDPEYVPVKDVVWLNQINGQFAIFHGKIKFSSVLDPFNAVRLFI